MGVSSYLEFVTTLFGWIIYQGIWAVLVDTGIVFIPLIATVVANIASSHRAGEDEGSAGKQSLKKNEVDLYMMFAVMIFAAIPVLDVELTEMDYVKPALECGTSSVTVDGNDTDTTYDRTLATISGQTGGIPIWWALAHVQSKGFTAASIAAIPCAPDLASVEYRLANDGIEDPNLSEEIKEFTDDCYRRSKSRLMRSDTSALTPAQLEDTNWLGSEYFLATSGYYNRYYAQNPQSLFPFSPTRDAGFDADAVSGGHPLCTEWWADSSKGLRQKVLDSIDPDLLNDMVYGTGNLVSESTTTSLTRTEREDVFLRKYLAINRARERMNVDAPLSVGYQQNSIDNAQRLWDRGEAISLNGAINMGMHFVGDVARTTSAVVGAAAKAPEALGEAYMIRQGVSMFQALALMIFIIILPLLLVFSSFKASTLLTLTIIYFGIHFMSMLWAVAYWIDNNLMTMMTTGARLGIFEAAASPVQSGLIIWMQRFLYIVFPVMYLSGLGWIGINTGRLASGVEGFGGKAAAPGAVGGAALGKVGSAVVTKGEA
ncbi:MAG: conjugal transfer protein TraG N-terminal domain-containing protein [Pseudomonadota bacterium]